MSSKTGEVTSAQFRLAYARRKLRAFLRQIEELQTSEFPHEDSRTALEQLAKHFASRLRSATRAIARDEVADELLAQVNISVGRYTDLLGFILRSTNVRNSFEAYFPLKRLVQQMIGENAHLITSAEWRFIPFTYPMNIDALPNFVLVGSPAPETDNVLILPLAGHEIGHSAWRRHNIEASVKEQFLSNLKQSIDSDQPRRDELLKNVFGGSDDVRFLILDCYKNGIKQLEEIFCDYTGLYIFGQSYLYAYDYFLAPGSGARSAAYPKGSARVKFLLQAADNLGLESDLLLFARWRDASKQIGFEADLMEITDTAVENTIPNLWSLATDLFQMLGLSPNQELVVERVLRNFVNGVPDRHGASLSEIVTAGWRYLRGYCGLPDEDDDRHFEMLNELMLKSIEVSEYRLRLSQ